MKRFVILLLACLLLAGCAGAPEAAPTPAATPEAAPTPEITTTPAPEAVLPGGPYLCGKAEYMDWGVDKSEGGMAMGLDSNLWAGYGDTPGLAYNPAYAHHTYCLQFFFRSKISQQDLQTFRENLHALGVFTRDPEEGSKKLLAYATQGQVQAILQGYQANQATLEVYKQEYYDQHNLTEETAREEAWLYARDKIYQANGDWYMPDPLVPGTLCIGLEMGPPPMAEGYHPKLQGAVLTCWLSLAEEDDTLEVTVGTQQGEETRTVTPADVRELVKDKAVLWVRAVQSSTTYYSIP